MTYAAIGAWCETLVWVLSHSLWQGALISALLWVVLRRLPARRANLRYGAAVGGLAAVMLSSFATWSVLRLPPATPTSAGEQSPIRAVSASAIAADTTDATAADVQGSSLASSSAAESSRRVWTVWLAGLWLFGAGVVLVRRSASVLKAQRWAAASAGLSGFDLSVLQELTRELSARLGLQRAVRLLVSEKVNVPAVVGTLSPCVLLPVAMLTGVPVEQWRIILAHELAHIRRYDELVNLAQMLAESLLFFNPAVWWLSRQVRIEREACCDALAAAVSGPPLSVARTLVDVAASLQFAASLRPLPVAPVAALAIAQPGRPGELTDRVQRLVDPDRASRPSVSGFGLGVVLLAIVMAGALLQQGTDLAVRAAAQLMSPRERVERIARLQAEANSVFLAPATNPGPVVPPKEAKKANADEEASAEKLKVTLVVRTEDGTPIPKGLQLTTLSVTSNASYSTGLSGPGKELPEYRKTFDFRPSRLRMGAHAKGFAVAVSPIMNLFAGEPERTVELILKRGAKATLKITDEQERPIAGAELRTYGRVWIGGSSSGHDSRVFKADEHGIVALDHIGDLEYNQELRATGFQRADRVGVLDVAAPMEWRMKPARPTPVKVVDAASGAPIAKARFELASSQRSSHRSGGSDPRERKEASSLTYAETDAHGHAVLSELRDGTSYLFGILAPGYGMGLLEDVEAGQPEQVIRLAPPLKLAGRVSGAVERLSKWQGKAGERYLSYFARLHDHISNRSGSVTVDAQGRFEITGLVAGERVTVYVADVPQHFIMKASQLNVELKVPEPTVARTFAKREVVIRLVGTAPGAAARGTLWINTSHADPTCRDLYNGSLPIRDNEVRLNVPIGARLSFEPRNLAGYVIEPRQGLEVTAGEGPQLIEAPARPAGAIHGSVVRADGSPATGAFVSVFASKLPVGEKDHGRLNPSTASGSPTFLLTAPLGGRYRVLARESSESHYLWAISDEVTLDENQPIAQVRLALPEGQPLRIKVVDPDGRPVAKQPVHLEIGFSQAEPPSSFSASLDRRTDADGVAFFDHLSLNADIKPLRVTYYVTAPPTKFMGFHSELDPNRPLEIRLQRGLSASGVLVEAATGKPIPRAEVRIFPRDITRAQFRSHIRTKTNERGEFHFEGLEDQEYDGAVDGSVPKGTIITKEADGTRFTTPAGVVQPRLRAGDQNVRWEVVIYPGSSLKAAD